MYKIYIDAGHGGIDSGGTGFSRKEKNDALKMAQAIYKLLKTQSDFTPILSRNSDINKDLNKRISEANTQKCSYYLSIHRDAFNNKTANGTSIYVYSQASDKTIKFAKNIINNVLAVTDFYNRGLKFGAPNYTNFAVNRDTNMPACLFEIGFITNENDNAIFDKKFEQIALAITVAICENFGIKYDDETEKNVYKVQSGDNLTEIAKKYKTTVNELVKINKKKYPTITANFIRTNWNLKVR